MPKTTIQEFDPDSVRPMPGQPRKRFKGITELAESIQEIGQSTPGIVTLIDDDPRFKAQLVDGERRLRACKRAGVSFRAEVRSPAAAAELFVASFGANFGKQDHDPMEIAEGLARIQAMGRTIEQLARIAGKSTCWVSQHLSLLKLHPEVQKQLISETDESPPLNFSLAQLLVPLPEPRQLVLARRCVRSGGMTVAAARRIILKERHAAGDTKVYRNKTGAKRQLHGLEGMISDTTDRLGIFLDMPGPDLNALIDTLDGRSKRELIERSRELIEGIEGIIEQIQSRLPKLHHVKK